MEKNHGIKWLLFFGAASAAALGGALVSQFVFGLHPCHLCLLQRWPYGLVILLSTGLFFHKKVTTAVFIVFGLLFFGNTLIAGYHTGVEQKWWAGPSDCTSTENPNSIEALTQAILNAPTVRCDEPAFVFLGLSMAAWNVFYSLGLAGLAIWRSRN